MFIKINSKKYEVNYASCFGYKCFVPGEYMHRAQLPSGGSMKSSDRGTLTCMTNAYHGCPDVLIHDSEIVKFRKNNKWRLID